MEIKMYVSNFKFTHMKYLLFLIHKTLFQGIEIKKMNYLYFLDICPRKVIIFFYFLRFYRMQLSQIYGK